MIVAFTKDWDDVPTCTTHILREMAKSTPVLWVSSIGTRKPSAASPKDVRRILSRLVSGLRPAAWKENNLRVLKPILIPKAQSAVAVWANRLVFGWYLRRELASWMLPSEHRPEATAQGHLEYWCFVPNAVDLLPRGARGALQRETKGTEPRDGTAGNGGDRGCPEQEGTEETEVRKEGHRPPATARLIYYCADDWTKFASIDSHWMAQKERELLTRTDIVFASSRYLVEKLSTTAAKSVERHTWDVERRAEAAAPSASRQASCVIVDDLQSTDPGASSTSHVPRSTFHGPPPIHYMPHGVEYDRFSQALDKSVPIPDEIESIPRPVIGFYGNLHPWVDFGLIGKLAEAMPERSFVVIGERYSDVGRLARLPNVYLLGRRSHDALHHYCRAFDVAIIPYDMDNPRMESVNPVKTKELLAAGVPVVASDVPELRTYGNRVLTCAAFEDWVEAIDSQLRRADRKEISESMCTESWDARVAQIRRIVDR